VAFDLLTPEQKRRVREARLRIYKARVDAGTCLNCGKRARQCRCRLSERVAANTEFEFMKRGGPDR
jgi:DTW domain-containing protein YfiP